MLTVGIGAIALLVLSALAMSVDMVTHRQEEHLIVAAVGVPKDVVPGEVLGVVHVTIPDEIGAGPRPDARTVAHIVGNRIVEADDPDDELESQHYEPVASGDKPVEGVDNSTPPVDNAHVSPGAEQFTDQAIKDAANSTNTRSRVRGRAATGATEGTTPSGASAVDTAGGTTTDAGTTEAGTVANPGGVKDDFDPEA